jgi:DNA-binding transcriptional ArsR family regulator
MFNKRSDGHAPAIAAHCELRRKRHGQRMVLENLAIETVTVAAVNGQRLEILRVLVGSPMCVSAIAKAMFSNIKTVSRELKRLVICGLVTQKPQKTMRIYSLSDRVKAFRDGDMIQIVVSNGNGHWVVFHLDDTADPEKALPPPTCFIKPRHGRRKRS